MCCFCGTKKATTKDHVPPKAIFNKPRPNDLITVPSCFECNNLASQYDEKFKVYLGMHIAGQGGEAERLFKEGVLSTTKHNKKLRLNIFKSMYPIEIITKGGTKALESMAVPWDSEAHDFTIERITKGLFYHHFKKIVEQSVIVKTYWFKTPQQRFDDITYEISIANGAFRYNYNKVNDANFDSVWLFNFYNSHFAGGILLSEG